MGRKLIKENRAAAPITIPTISPEGIECAVIVGKPVPSALDRG